MNNREGAMAPRQQRAQHSGSYVSFVIAIDYCPLTIDYDICSMQSIGDRLTHFYQSLQPPQNLPRGVDVLFPQKDPQVIAIVEKFFEKYFNDDHPRSLMLGINPGRFGAGITGVNFTAPKQLKEHCGIEHHFKPSSELSAEFIYEMIMAYGGVEKFYRDWFIGSVCPLGLVARPTAGNIKKTEMVRRRSNQGDVNTQRRQTEGKNINYYDNKKLLQALTPFIIDCINKQVKLGFKTGKCICVGGEKNFKFLSALNKEHKWFGEIVPLPHPRFILQYRRKQKDEYIRQYLSALMLAR
jgi:hypothetical protein